MYIYIYIHACFNLTYAALREQWLQDNLCWLMINYTSYTELY